MRKINTGSASVMYASLGEGSAVCVAQYTGELDGARMVRLRDAVISVVRDVGAFVVTVDQARLLMDVTPFIPADGEDYEAMPDGCVVCRQDQLDVMTAYSQHMADHGVIRAVFLGSQRLEAEAFARRHVEIHRGGRRRL